MGGPRATGLSGLPLRAHSRVRGLQARLLGASIYRHSLAFFFGAMIGRVGGFLEGRPGLAQRRRGLHRELHLGTARVVGLGRMEGEGQRWRGSVWRAALGGALAGALAGAVCRTWWTWVFSVGKEAADSASGWLESSPLDVLVFLRRWLPGRLGLVHFVDRRVSWLGHVSRHVSIDRCVQPSTATLPVLDHGLVFYMCPVLDHGLVFYMCPVLDHGLALLQVKRNPWPWSPSSMVAVQGL